MHLSSGLPDFAKVYSFIGSVFDPDTKGHMHELKDMDPINFETVSIVIITSNLKYFSTLVVIEDDTLFSVMD